MSSEQEEEITVERAKEYFEDLKIHFRSINKIITDEVLAELSRQEA
jgi:hypothetical protein